MTKFREFEAAMSREAKTLLAELLEAKPDVVSRRILGLLDAGEDGSQRDEVWTEPKEQLVIQLHLRFGEIAESVEALQDIAVYVRSFPYRRSGISKVTYLRYHVENYLDELYILQNRMKAYLVFIARQYRLDSRSDRISALGQAVKEHFTEALSDAVTARGTHVHQRRHSDQDLVRLRLLWPLRDDEPRRENIYELSYKQARKSKRLWIEQTNRMIETLLDVYFEYLLELLFDHDGRLRFPEKPA